MSRSYKHNNLGIVKDPAGKNMKRFANKAVRRYKGELPAHGKSYKKLFESWNISDYYWVWTKEDAIHEWETGQVGYWHRNKFKTLQEYLAYWKKCVKRK